MPPRIADGGLPGTDGGGKMTTTFIIQFMPTSEGPKTAALSIANNDSDENPYDITLLGTGGPIGPMKIIESKALMRVTSPQGDTGLRAGSLQMSRIIIYPFGSSKIYLLPHV